MRLILLMLLLLPIVATAAEPEMRGEYKSWTTYRYAEASGTACYAMARAEKTTDAKGKKLNIKSRGQVLLQITRRPSEGSNMAVSFVAGHSMKKQSAVTGTTNKGKFELRANGDTAWTANPAADAAIIGMIRAANWLTIKHQDKKGNVVIDHFSLGGSTNALADIANCN